MPTDDLYAVLGVPATASASEIRQAYKAAALRLHPDRTGDTSANGQAAFQRVAAAYTVLSSEATRAEHDRNLMRGRRSCFSQVRTPPCDDGAGKAMEAEKTREAEATKYSQFNAFSQFVVKLKSSFVGELGLQYKDDTGRVARVAPGSHLEAYNLVAQDIHDERMVLAGDVLVAVNGVRDIRNFRNVIAEARRSPNSMIELTFKRAKEDSELTKDDEKNPWEEAVVRARSLTKNLYAALASLRLL
jgi:curved DNA-binding protein CbpA